jgi:spoIIIJ-associated protein
MPGGRGQRNPGGDNGALKGERMDATGNSGTAEGRQVSGAFEPTSGETGSIRPEEVGDRDHEGEAVMSAPEEGAFDSPEGRDDPAEAAAGEEEEPIDSAALARDLLDQILQAMSVPATVGAQRQPDGSIRLFVEGPEMGVVIGKHGATINALQYLVGLIVQKRSGERIRLVIDAEGYRSRREQALKEMALTYAQRVKETGHEAVLDALQSYERRIIHNTLSDDPDVFTYSEGEEPDRRVVISPRDGEPDEG